MGKEVHQSIVIDAKIKTTLENMDKTVNQLQQGLSKGITSLDISKGIGNSLSKTMSVFKTEFEKFSELTKSGSLELVDSKKALQSGEKIVEKYREIQRIVRNFDDLKLIDAKKLFPDAFKSEIGEFQNKLQILRQNLNNLEIKGMEATAAETKLTALQTQAEELKSKLIDEKILSVNVEQANSKLDSATQKIENIRTALKEELKLKLDTADLESSRITKEIEKIEKARAGRDIKDLAVGAGGHVTYQGKTSKQWEKSGASKEQVAAAQQAIQVFAAEEKELNKLREALASSEKEATKLRAAFAGFGDKTDLVKTAQMLGKGSSDIEQTKNALDEQAQAAEKAKNAQENLNNAQTNNKNAKKDIDNNSAAIQDQEQKVQKLRLQYDALFGKIDVSKLQQGLAQTLGKDFSPELLQNKEGIEQILQKLQETDQTSLQKLKQELINLGDSADQAEDYITQLKNGLNGIRATGDDIRRTASDVDMLKNRFMYFFSLTNSVQLFRRAVTKALNNVKELDKTMTEAAVVTKFSVGDMWDKLPQYSEEAQKLGVSINGMYEATTLYYQQGLKTNAAMGIGIETMKMAKIAAMDSTDATKAMTAALRGFNMALNETSAQKVNDVYSQLAAVTAADTNSIATAMEKTASIAASANMEFETTAALLAQIIETTQEAPETAGTAMKTIIARFAEVKSLRDKGEITGTDEEGEEIDVNKIQTALRSVGISMDGFFAGTEGLDDVLLKLASKWDSLDFTTQRYIATMAAGSRQQSRFIAMMSNYSRTVELVDKANNSAGASQKQFEKTLESMESKLQRLKNAWDQFTMGLANNEILKGAVDILTSIIEGINKLTNGISGGNGLIKSITSLGVAIGGLMAGKSLINMLFGGAAAKAGGAIGGMFGFGGRGNPKSVPTGVPVGQEVGFGQSFKKLGGAVTNKAVGFGNTVAAPFKAAKEGYTIKKITKNEAKFAKFRTQTEAKFDKEDSMSDQAMGVRRVNEQLAEGQIDTKQAAAEYEKLGLSMKDAGVDAELLGEKVDNTQSSNQRFVAGTQKTAGALKSMSGAMFTAGAACAGLSALLSAMGYDEAAEKMAKLSGIIMGVGAIFMALGPIVSGVGKVIAAAGLTAQAAWWWIFIIVAAIAGLIVLIVALSNENKSFEKQLEETNKQIEQMTAASKEAEEALENIASTREELKEMQDVFSGLVKGTTEWKKALVESNAKVLEMLDLYPQLAAHIVNTDGLLSIETAGWEAIIEAQTQAMIQTQSITVGLQMKKNSLEGDQLFAEYTSGKIGEEEYAAKAGAYEIQGDILQDSYYTSIIAQSDYLSNSDYAETAAIVQGLGQTSNQLVDSIEDIEVASGKHDEDKLVKEYAKIVGKEEDVIRQQLENGDLSREDMAQSIKLSRAAESAIKQMEETAKAIAKISNKSDRELIQKILSNNGDGLTKTDIDSIKEQIGEITPENVANYLSGQGINLTEEQITTVAQNLNNVDDAYDTKFTQGLQNIGLDKDSKTNQFLQGLDYGTASQFMNKINQMFASGATANDIEKIFADIEKYVVPLGEDNLKLLAEGNWGSKNSITDTMDYFKTQDDVNVEGIDGLSNNIIELTKAVSENTSAQLRSEGYAIQDLIRGISSGEIDPNALTGEQRDAIARVLGNSNAFTQIGTDKWQYKGDLYGDLANKYTSDMEEGAGILQDKKENIGRSQKYIQKKPDQYGRTSSTAEVVRAAINEGFTTKRKLTSDELLQVVEYYRDSESGYNYGLSEDEIGQVWVAYQNMTDYNNTSSDPIDMAQAMDKWAFYGTGLSWADYQIGDDPNGEKAQKIKAAYIQAATTLEFSYDENTTPEQMLFALQQWDKTWGDTEGFVSEYEEEAKQSAQWVATNIDSYTTDIGWQTFTSEKEQEKYNKERGKALDDRLKSTGGLGYIDDIEKAIEDAGESADDFTDSIKALASDLAITETKIKALATNMKNLSPALSENSNSPEYQQALGAAKIQVADYFQVSVEQLDAAGIADSFYEELAKGNGSVLPQIGMMIAQSFVSDLNMSEINPLLTPTVNEEGIMALFKQLGGVEEDFGGDMNKIVEFVATRLGWIGVRFAAEFDEVLGEWKGTTHSFDASSLFTSGYNGGGGSSNKWKNEYDELYNLVEKINEELRTREKLELRYERLLKRNAANAKKLAENTRAQLASLRTEETDRKKVLAGRERQIQETMSEYSDLNKYAIYNKDTKQIEIDWDLLEGLDGSTDEELTTQVEEYISKLEEQQEQIEEEQDKLDEINDGVWEIFKQGKDEYFDLEDQIKEAIISERQKEIDKLTAINDSINEANSKILDAMQEQIDQYRENRDNQEKEEEIADKQRQLAYLQMDTSGANALDILRLQEEIDESQQDYTDTLIDQKISELQKQNDEAAEQRQQQIDIMQAQLDQYSESAAIWNEVNALMSDGLDPETGLIRGRRLEELLKSADGFDGMSKLKKMDWLNELNNNVAQALAWLDGGGALQYLIGEGKQVTFTSSDEKTVTGTIDKDGNVTADEQIYKAENFRVNSDGTITTSESQEQARKNYQETLTPKEEEGVGSGNLASLPGSSLNSKQTKTLQKGLNELLEHGKLSGFAKLKVDGIYGNITKAAVKKLQAAIGESPVDGIWGSSTQKTFKNSSLKEYKTGGLADFTGPAWLDGTKSRPEYILNADQTKAFFTLVDVLSGLTSRSDRASEKIGDNTYDIDINVESIGSDYDVEQLATTVKRLINEDARYRNNNAINLMR